VPFLKKFEATVRCCTQNGIRGGSATVHFPIWHQEIEDILVLKNNKGTEDNRVRKLDYSIQISKLFYERFIEDKEITLFSPHSCPNLFESFGTPEFDELYCRYELDESIPKRTIGAQELIMNLLKERAETGRIYIMNIDHCNEHSSFKDKVSMSNLCQEITLPTEPIQHIDSIDGEIALCILSAINVGKIGRLEELEDLCDLSVRSLEELIDYQDYPVRAAEIATLGRRSLGVGFIGLAHYLAKNGHKYDSQGAWDAVHRLTESFQYHLLKASNQIAKEKGPCADFTSTKYSDGILPIDTYKNDVDEITQVELKHDWESLRASILEFGLRHSTLSAQMPSESSSVVSNATNGIEPPRDYLSIKKSKKGPLKQVVPSYGHLKNNYTLLWEMQGNDGYIKVVAVMQKFFDQAISGNWSYNPTQYPDNEVPISVMAQDFLATYKYGWKTSYYQNTYDMKSDDVDDVEEVKPQLEKLFTELSEEQECDSCTI
ncbi:MAG: ribonucleoside-diphosphate reductase subunit alpha, partial [Candidatus Thermoplasmatota archaeon]|nr:ribonucleoside-diphosphate reductase subunit alpha [Candidatus Thermoplasmatota archaeon]